jgi:predicted SAM-dependent methyltransferase
MKLHLGCGRNYLNGYINIDYPATEHTVQADLMADIYADLTKLSYPFSSIDEIRLHHVFEHFSRPVTLALLCRWRDWLKPGGLLRIETPDAMACFKSMINPLISFDNKQQIMRHLFGSHEASWAVHWDGWYKEKFTITLNTLGFENLRYVRNEWGHLHNIEVFAYKSKQNLVFEEYSRLVESLLELSIIKTTMKDKQKTQIIENDMLDVWMKMWRTSYEETK